MSCLLDVIRAEMRAKQEKFRLKYGFDASEFTTTSNIISQRMTISHPQYGVLELPMRGTHEEVERLFDTWLGKDGQ